MGFGYKVQHTGIQMSIANAQVTLDRTSFTYDESQHAPVVQLVQVGDAELVEFQDYVAYITPATDAGNYNVIVSGMGDYSGAKNVPWRIDKAQGTISVEPQSVQITGAIGTTAKATLNYTGDGEITFGESEYVTIQRSGTELTITSKAAGSGSVTIIMADGQNYKGATAELQVEVSTLPAADPVFANNTWETIARVAAMGEASKHWNVGDTKTSMFNGGTYKIRILGFDIDDLSESDAKYNDPSYNKGSNKAAITLDMGDRVDFRSSYRPGSLKSEVLNISDFKQFLESGLVENLRTVKKCDLEHKKYTNDDVFQLSASELGCTYPYEIPDMGEVKPNEAYPFFQTDEDRKKKMSGYATNYWLRDKYVGTDKSSQWHYITSKGVLSDMSDRTKIYVAEAFCI